MPCWTRRRVSSLPKMWHSSTAPPGVVALPETATRTGHMIRPFFRPWALGQVEKGVVDGLEGPLGHGLEDRYHRWRASSEFSSLVFIFLWR